MPVRVMVTFALLVAVAGVLIYSWQEGDRHLLIIRTVVIGGALMSMVLHELSHGLVAYYGGDRTVKDRGFLTLNPLKYWTRSSGSLSRC